MSTIAIKDMPPAMHQALKARAKAHGRSLSKEVIATLEGTMHDSPIDAHAIRGHARAVREAMGVYLTEENLSELKDAGRR